MGWGTTLTTDIYYNRKSYNNLYEVEEDLKTEQDYVNSLKDEIRMLIACTDPAKIMPQDENWQPFEWLHTETARVLNELEEALWERDKYQMLVDAWDECHKDGVAIACPDGVTGSYLEGDFVKTNKNNNEENDEN